MKKQIVVIEDEKGIALALRLALQQAGYDVLVAANGMSGLELSLKTRPNLILLDLILPIMDGYLVLEGLKQNEETCRIPVFMISAKAQEHDLLKARTLGAAEYLVKPFRLTDLVDLIQRYLN